MLRFEGLGKSYGGRTIFHHACLNLGAGAYALQGANGIGKSTLLSMLAGAQPADAGEVWIDGINLAQSLLEARQRLSYVPDESPIYPFMTGRELLDFIAKAKKAEVGQNIQTLIRSFGLDAYLSTRFAAMSLGTQKKFMLSAAWIGAPAVLLFDEPSNGLDADARSLLAKLLQEKGQHSTILFTTHDADFVAAAGATVIKMEQLISRQSSA